MSSSKRGSEDLSLETELKSRLKRYRKYRNGFRIAKYILGSASVILPTIGFSLGFHGFEPFITINLVLTATTACVNGIEKWLDPSGRQQRYTHGVNLILSALDKNSRGELPDMNAIDQFDENSSR